MRFKRVAVTGSALGAHAAFDVATGGLHLFADALAVLIIGLAALGVGRWLVQWLRTGSAPVQ